jgi:hypothetical protein
MRSLGLLLIVLVFLIGGTSPILVGARADSSQESRLNLIEKELLAASRNKSGDRAKQIPREQRRQVRACFKAASRFLLRGMK